MYNSEVILSRKENMVLKMTKGLMTPKLGAEVQGILEKGESVRGRYYKLDTPLLSFFCIFIKIPISFIDKNGFVVQPYEKYRDFERKRNEVDLGFEHTTCRT
jgi:hypothetical protein